MNLLLQAIQEYLAENHSDWATSQYPYDTRTIYIVNTEKSPKGTIAIFTTTQTMVINDYRHRIVSCIGYTDCTLLSQITKIISKVEQP